MRRYTATVLALIAGAYALTVLAASSLTESLQQVGAAWQAQGNPAVTFSFDASSKLAKQVEAGIPADLFFSADEEWMDYLDKRGLIEPRVVLLANSLVAIVRSDAPFVPTSVGEMANPAVKRLALAGENVPAGKYARAALADVWPVLKDRVVSGDNVRTALAWVATGEAEAGVVYATDARIDQRVKVAFTFPATQPIVYPTAVLKSAGPDAARFLAFCQSAAARSIFGAAGFTEL